MKKMHCFFVPLCVFLVVFGLLSQNGLAQQVVMYASLGGTDQGATDGGAIVTVNQTTGAVTVLGFPVPGAGITGIDFDSRERLFGVTSSYPSGPRLIQINPRNGSLIQVVGPLLYSGNPVAITDIAFQPGTDVLFGSAAGGGGLSQNDLVTINTSNGNVTLVGTPAYTNSGGFVALAFSPNGTLYAKDANAGHLWTVNPTNATVTSTISITPNFGGIGLGIRPTDGLLFFPECCTSGSSFGNDLYSLNASTGVATLIGAAGGTRRVHDIAFVRPSPGIPVMTQWGVIILITLFGAAALVCMRRRMARI